jgi:hypothetical protein
MIDKTINTAVDKVQLITYKFVLELLNNYDIARVISTVEGEISKLEEGLEND